MRFIALIVLAVVVLVLTSAIWVQGVLTSRDNARLESPGETFTIGDARLHLYCSGPQGGGSIIFENGMGVVSDSWTRVHAILDDTYRVCRYDRAGTGHSPAYDGPVDAASSARRLGRLIAAAELEQPVILVGHSFGGLIGRVFADQNPGAVAGLVLVDSAHEDMREQLPPEGQALVDNILNAFGLLEMVNRFGILRLIGPPAPWMTGLEGDARRRARAVYSRVEHMRGAAAESASWRDGRSTQQARSIESLGDLPMLVIVADDYPHGLAEPWLELQQDLAALSSQSRIEVARGADHFGLIQTAHYAERVAIEIDDFAKETVRAGP